MGVERWTCHIELRRQSQIENLNLQPRRQVEDWGG